MNAVHPNDAIGDVLEAIESIQECLTDEVLERLEAKRKLARS
jgi:hypothetical protein